MAADTSSSSYEAEACGDVGFELHPGCPGLPDCRWLAGLLPYNGPFVTDHAGWHEAGSHATVYGLDGPSCTCGAGTYQGDNDGAFPHLAGHEMVVVCADTGRRIGYSGETLDPNTPGGRRAFGVVVSMTQCDLDLIAVAADDSGMAVEEWMREAALLLAGRNGPTLAAIRDRSECSHPESEAHGPSLVMIPGLSPEDVSRLAYACDVLAVHASSGDFRTWASTTAERFRSLLWDLANPHRRTHRQSTGDTGPEANQPKERRHD